MKHYIKFIVFCVTLLSYKIVYGVGFNVRTLYTPDPVSVEFTASSGERFGGVILPGETLKLDTLFGDITRIRWMVGCKGYELIEKIPGILGWKDATIKGGEIELGTSGFLDSKIGWFNGTQFWSGQTVK